MLECTHFSPGHFFFLFFFFLGVACPLSEIKSCRKTARGRTKSTGKCKKKGRISRRHPSFLKLRLQTLGYAHFSCAGVGGKGAGEVLGEWVCDSVR